MVTMKNYLKEDEDIPRNYDYAEAGGKPYIIIRNPDGSTTKLLIDKNAKYYNDLKRDVERSGNSFNQLRDEFIKRKEAQEETRDSKTEPPKPETDTSSQQPPKPKPQLPDIRGGDGTPIETKKEPESPKEKPQSEPPRQDPPKPRQTPQQKAGLPARVPTKFVSRVAQYQKDRASAVKSGDPVEMQKVRTSGMEIWKKANPKLADAAAEKARIRGTAQTDNPLIDKQMRSRMPLNSPSVQSPRVAKLGSGNQSLVNNPNAFKAAKRPATAATSAKPVATPDKPVATSATKKGPIPLKVEPYKESYDVVLEYLLDGHADTINEANYIMLEMDSQTIQYIVNQS
tara:strand:- start:65 stop:1090 length:1026 start_codon:yes stop_codon:yes gene_type:complete